MHPSRSSPHGSVTFHGVGPLGHVVLSAQKVVVLVLVAVVVVAVVVSVEDWVMVLVVVVTVCVRVVGAACGQSFHPVLVVQALVVQVMLPVKTTFCRAKPVLPE